jgi:hypothetical protein
MSTTFVYHIQISAGERSKKLGVQIVLEGLNLHYTLIGLGLISVKYWGCPPRTPSSTDLQLDRFTRQAKPITCLCFLFRAGLWTVWVATLEPIDLMLAWPRGWSNCHWRLLRLWRLLEKLLMLLLGGVHKLRWQDKVGRGYWKCQRCADFPLLQ